jgi:hypothetical protein
MEKSSVEVAKRLLSSGVGFGDLRVHQFKHDLEAHDDNAIARLYAEFVSDFERVQADLSECYGEPVSLGIENDKRIPLGGVFRFAIWQAEGQLLYAVVAHEDRGCPVLLLLGITK